MEVPINTEYAATAEVERWVAASGGRLLVERLRTALGSDFAVARVLRVIDATCDACWDADVSGDALCYCLRDE